MASLGELYAKHEQKKICKSKFTLQLLFSSFFCGTRFDDTTVGIPSKKRSRIFMGSKVRGFGGTISVHNSVFIDAPFACIVAEQKE